MRAIITGQVGMDKKEYLQNLVELARDRGETIDVYHVGDMMYHEAPDVRPGRILDLPLSRLAALRRAVFRDIITDSAGKKNVIVNTHATFRWRHGLFSAFDFEQMRRLAPDMLICLVDNIESVHYRLHQEHTIDASLKDLMVWREEEIMATDLLAQALDCGNRNYVLARGRNVQTTETAFKLICRHEVPRVYPSFPMTHVMHLPEVLAEIEQFKADLARHFIAFDPADADEKQLLESAIAAAKQGVDFVDGYYLVGPHQHQPIRVAVREVLDIAGDVDGQIYARDFKLIDQSDMIVSLVPELPGGVPGLSSGVERELQHAFEHGKEVYVVWKPRRKPSPFITETATRVFSSTAEALQWFEEKGMFHPASLFG